MEQKIKDALSKLDLADDALWTADGLPRLDAPGLGGKFTRADVTKAAPLFSRSRPVVETPTALDEDDEAEKVDEDGRSAGAAPEVDTVFTMKASDFGAAAGLPSDDEDEVDGPSAPPPTMTPEEVEERIARAERQLKEANAAAQHAERLKSEAAAERDKAVREQEFLDASDPHKGQRSIMAYLESTKRGPKPAAQGASPPPAPSPIDKALAQRRSAYGTARPKYPTHQ